MGMIRVAWDIQIFNVFRGGWGESIECLQGNPAGHGEYRSHGWTVEGGLGL